MASNFRQRFKKSRFYFFDLSNITEADDRYFEVLLQLLYGNSIKSRLFGFSFEKTKPSDGFINFQKRIPLGEMALNECAIGDQI